MAFPRDWIERNQSLYRSGFFLFNAALCTTSTRYKKVTCFKTCPVCYFIFYFFNWKWYVNWIQLLMYMRASALCRAWKWICVTSAAMMNESRERERGERRAIAQRPKSLRSTQVAAEAWGDCCVCRSRMKK
jgi:hypothetical protein